MLRTKIEGHTVTANVGASPDCFEREWRVSTVSGEFRV